MKTNSGLNDEARFKIGQMLNLLLADEYVPAVTTRDYHRNVTGLYFPGLHRQFEEHYVEVAANIDAVAERARAIGIDARGNWAELTRTGRSQATSAPASAQSTRSPSSSGSTRTSPPGSASTAPPAPTASRISEPPTSSPGFSPGTKPPLGCSALNSKPKKPKRPDPFPPTHRPSFPTMNKKSSLSASLAVAVLHLSGCASNSGYHKADDTSSTFQRTA
jgi:hypothetical protein